MKSFRNLLAYLCLAYLCGVASGMSTSSTTKPFVEPLPKDNTNSNTRTFKFSIPLKNPRPKPESFFGTVGELWNDPRPVSSVLFNDRFNVGTRLEDTSMTETNADLDDMNESKSASIDIPYCIISDEFEIQNQKFQILLYPRGRFVSGGTGNSNGDLSGPASAYLRYLPSKYGDEVDIGWRMKLVNGITNESLPIVTSGGLPKSKDTWSSAMTFCTENEAIESAGRATDWGSSTWFAKDVIPALGDIRAEGEMIVYDVRTGESSFSLPPFEKGALGEVRNLAVGAAQAKGQTGQEQRRDFRVGEVIVPTQIMDDTELRTELRKSFVYPGVDYRIMTMADGDGNPIFSTRGLEDQNELDKVKLALRPCGWKTQQQVWNKSGVTNEWPVEVEARKLSGTSLTRFNVSSGIPRIIAAFQRDWVTYTLALLLAMAPIPLTLLARSAVSLYVIPSASMEPTLLKGDVLLVEKLPGVYERTNRGDVILFRPPDALRDIVLGNGSQLSSTSLFVKRIVGLPGDNSIQMTPGSNDVTIDGEPAVGPDRSLCTDEPLRLIDRLLEKGKGRSIDKLTSDDVYVLGDCKAVSVDSRVFGTLPKENIAGRPLARIWPLDRIKMSGDF